MAEIVGLAEAFAGALAEVAPVLDERARRLLMGAAARQLGRGGITLIATATGAASTPTPTRKASGSPTRRLIAFETAHLQRLKFHGNWNYTVTGTPAGNTTRPEGQEKFISEPLAPSTLDIPRANPRQVPVSNPRSS